MEKFLGFMFATAGAFIGIQIAGVDNLGGQVLIGGGLGLVGVFIGKAIYHAVSAAVSFLISVAVLLFNIWRLSGFLGL